MYNFPGWSIPRMRTNVPRGVSAIELVVLTAFDRIIKENVIHNLGKQQRERFTNYILGVTLLSKLLFDFKNRSFIVLVMELYLMAATVKI